MAIEGFNDAHGGSDPSSPMTRAEMDELFAEMTSRRRAADQSTGR